MTAEIDTLVREGRHAEAAELALKHGDPVRAADLFAAVWEWGRAIDAVEKTGRLDEAYRHALAANDRAAVTRLLAALAEKPDQAVRAAAHAQARGRTLDAARLHELAGDVAGAAEMYEQGGELFEAARCRESEGQYRQAGMLYERRMRESPDDHESALRLGRILAHFGRYEHAVRALQHAARDEERAGAATRLLVACFAALGMDDAAASRLDELRREDPALPITVADFLQESFGDTRGLPALVGAQGEDAQDRRLLAGRYRVLRPIGAGATGRVLLAYDVFYDREVAVKVLTVGAGGAGRDAFVRFAREARVAAGMHHPNVVRVLDFNPDGPFLVMEHMAGGTLEDRLGPPGEGRKMQLAAIRSAMSGILAALEAVHRRGVVHRDLKPANVFFGPGGDAKLGDFGVAHLADLGATLTGALLGTLAYMAPEQITGSAKPDASTDLYALGVILHRALTGELPFPGPDFVTQHLQNVPPAPSTLAPDLGDACDAFVASLLAKDQTARPHTAAAALALLQALPWTEPDGRHSVAGAGSTAAAASEPPERAPSIAPGVVVVGGRYEIEAELEDGSRRAIDRALGRSVILAPVGADDLERVRAYARADSPYLQAVFDVLEERQAPVVAVIEDPEGRPLAGLVLDPGGRAAVRAAVWTALKYLHGQGIAHGAVRPDHVFVGDGRTVLLLPRGTTGGSTDADLAALEGLI